MQCGPIDGQPDMLNFFLTDIFLKAAESKASELARSLDDRIGESSRSLAELRAEMSSNLAAGNLCTAALCFSSQEFFLSICQNLTFRPHVFFSFSPCFSFFGVNVTLPQTANYTVEKRISLAFQRSDNLFGRA